MTKKTKIGIAATLSLVTIFLLFKAFYKPTPGLSVSGTSPGITNVEREDPPDPIYIRFSGSAAPLEDIDKVLESGISMSPDVPGTWEWTSDRALKFTPSQDWPVGETFYVRFEEGLFPDHVKVDARGYEFNSPPFEAEFTKGEFYLHPKNPNIKKVVATVKFSHPVETEEFEQNIRVTDKKLAIFVNQDLPYTLKYNKFKTEAYIHVRLKSIPLNGGSAKFELKKGFGSSRGGRPITDDVVKNVSIPGIYSVFWINDTNLTLVRNERYEPEQVMILNLTNGAKEEEIQKNLEVFLLPVDRPAYQGMPVSIKHRWRDVRKIGPEVLGVSEKVELEPLPTDSEFSKIHSFKHNADPGRYFYIRLKKGTVSYGGYILRSDYETILRVPAYPKELKIMHDGALLSLSGDKTLSILSRGLESVRLTVEQILPSQVNHLVSQSGGRFKSPRFSNYRFSPENITRVTREERMLEFLGPGKTQYSSFDFSTYLASNGRDLGVFFFKVEEWDPIHKRPLGISDQRLILVTDMGLMVKAAGDGEQDVFVQNVRTGSPVEKARVEILGKNGLPVMVKTTGGDGHVKFPSLKGFEDHKEPTVFLVKKGADISFIPFNWPDRQLNLSRFDIGGEDDRVNREGISAFLFSDRGLYRPGETFHMGMIVKPLNWKQSLAGVPLEATVNDPRGLEIMKKRLSLNGEGFLEIDYTTEETSPTGKYKINLYTVKDGRRWSHLGAETVRVEEFEPDRMRITTRFSEQTSGGWVNPDGLRGLVFLNTLFGTPAENRRVRADIRLRPASPRFSKFEDYTFFDPLRAEQSFSEVLTEQESNEDGEADFYLDLQRFERATYRLTFTADALEAVGGRTVSSESSILVSPLDYLIGFKEDGPMRYITKGAKRSVSFIAIGPDLKQRQVSDLTVNLIRQQYVSVLMKQNDGTFAYESVRKETPINSEPITISDKGLTYPLMTEEPGDFVVVIKDAELNELNRVSYSIVGAANFAMNIDKNAELQVKLNKEDYSPGERIELQITAPYSGAGLITIERDRVYSYKWFKTTKTNSVQSINVPEKLEGNAYVNVSFLRAGDSKEIYMSPLSYGVAPFSISRQKRVNPIHLSFPKLTRPGEPLKIKYATDHPSKIVVYAVDEGILQVANYSLPDPLSFFFRKKALVVRTFQILDLILPEFRLIKKLSGIGGGTAWSEVGKNLNPFKRKRDKAVVFWSGIIEADKNARELTYEVPDYFDGTLRIMAVAVNEETMGNYKGKIIVRGYFVLTPNAPYFITPGDTVAVPVSVANNVEGSGKNPDVKISVSTSKHLTINGENTNTIPIPENREKSISFKANVNKLLGGATIQYSAETGGKKSNRSVGVSVRPAVPYITSLQAGHFKDKYVELETPRRMYPHYRLLEVAASPVPLVIAKGLYNYLDRYPYQQTCVLISQGIAEMALAEIPQIGIAKPRAVRRINRSVRLLRARQNSKGMFGFWTANAHASHYDAVYGLHFLTEAKELGYSIPEDLLAKGLSYLRSTASGDPYSVYVLTRNGIVTTNYLQTIRANLDRHKNDDWKNSMTGFYLAASYKLLKQDAVAESLIQKAKFGSISKNKRLGWEYGLIREAALLYVLSKHFPDHSRRVKGEDLEAMVDAINHGHFDSRSAAMTILGLSTYAKRMGPVEPSKIIFEEENKAGEKKKLSFKPELFSTVRFSENAEVLRIYSDSLHPLFFQLTQAGFDLDLPPKAMKNGLEIQREYQNEGGNTVESVRLGDEVTVRLKIRTIDDTPPQDVVVVDLFPSGFELIQESIQRPGPSEMSWSTQYVDGREDRVLVFGNVGPDVKEFVYRLRAISEGEFTVPPIFTESTEDKTLQALSLGGRMVIKN